MILPLFNNHSELQNHMMEGMIVFSLGELFKTLGLTFLSFITTQTLYFSLKVSPFCWCARWRLKEEVVACFLIGKFVLWPSWTLGWLWSLELFANPPMLFPYQSLLLMVSAKLHVWFKLWRCHENIKLGFKF